MSTLVTSHFVVPNPESSGDWIQITSLSNGHLRCEECIELWCEHIEKAILDYADAKTIWNIPETSFMGDLNDIPDLVIMVPIRPKENQWAKIMLGELTAVGRKIFLIRYDSAGLYPPDKDTTQIGYASPGEGRLTFRSVILEWFYTTEIYCHGKTCSSLAHSYEAQNYWEACWKDKGLKLAQLWSIYETTMCLVCAKKVASFDDLIPDPSSRKVW